MQEVLREVFQPEHAGIEDFRREDHLFARFCFGIEMEFDLEIGRREVAGIHIHRDVDIRLALGRRQRLRRVGILEAQVLEILPEDAHGGLAARLGRRRLKHGRALSFGRLDHLCAAIGRLRRRFVDLLGGRFGWFRHGSCASLECYVRAYMSCIAAATGAQWVWTGRKASYISSRTP